MMQTDDACLKDIAAWYVANQREMAKSELETIIAKHCGSEVEQAKFAQFLETKLGQTRFGIHLREAKERPTKLWMITRTGPEWDAYAAEQNRLSREHGEQRIIANWKGAGVAGNDIANIMRNHGILIPDSISKALQHDDTVVSVTMVEGRGINRSEAFVIHKWVSEQMAGIEKAISEGKPVPPEVLKDYPDLAKQKAQYLVESQVTTCDVISPQYYDILGLLDSVPSSSLLLEPEVKERKIDEVLKRLKEGVDSIQTSSVFREFLITMSKFHEYSVGNQILIMIQRKDATRVAGFNTWKDLGRYVKAGERGIMILAPCLPSRMLKCPICDRPFTEQGLRVHLSEFHQRIDVSELIRLTRQEAGAVMQPTPTYFKVVYVFDLSQTEGKPLPEFKVPVLTGVANEELFGKLLAHDKQQGLEVSFEPRPSQDPDIKGMYFARTIWVKPEESRAQQLKTLLHETAHYYTETVFAIPRADAETIAERSAFVVGSHFGFDTGTRTFPYVALWAQDKKVLERNLGSVRSVSSRIMDALEKG